MPSLGRAQHNPYGYRHKQRRAALLPDAVGTWCPLQVSPHCTGLMIEPALMQLDHTVPVVYGGVTGDRIVCKPCNLSAGATLGNERRTRRRTTRDWGRP